MSVQIRSRSPTLGVLVAQLAERLIVAQQVAGSSPAQHPKISLKGEKKMKPVRKTGSFLIFILAFW